MQIDEYLGGRGGYKLPCSPWSTRKKRYSRKHGAHAQTCRRSSSNRGKDCVSSREQLMIPWGGKGHIVGLGWGWSLWIPVREKERKGHPRCEEHVHKCRGRMRGSRMCNLKHGEHRRRHAGPCGRWYGALLWNSRSDMPHTLVLSLVRVPGRTGSQIQMI